MSVLTSAYESQATDQKASRALKDHFNAIVKDLKKFGFGSAQTFFSTRREYIIETEVKEDSYKINLLGATERFNRSGQFSGRMLTLELEKNTAQFEEPTITAYDGKGYVLAETMILGFNMSSMTRSGAVESRVRIPLSDEAKVAETISNWVKQNALKIANGAKGPSV